MPTADKEKTSGNWDFPCYFYFFFYNLKSLKTQKKAFVDKNYFKKSIKSSTPSWTSNQSQYPIIGFDFV